MKKIILGLSLIATLGVCSCDSYLDKVPDDRIVLNNVDGVKKLLITAYPTNDYLLATEMYSDNVTEIAENKQYGSHFTQELFDWKDPLEKNNESPQRFWESSWKSIYTATVALNELQKFEKTPESRAFEAEAKMVRAYNEFMLLNMFGQSYNPQYADQDLGVPYMYEPIKNIKAKLKRETVSQNYKAIEKDLTEALPNIDDNYYDVPKYHFNRAASYALACRFYLFYQKWDKVVEAANKVLQDNPAAYTTDWQAIANTTAKWALRTLKFTELDQKSNLMFLNSYSSLPMWWGYYVWGSRYGHTAYMASAQTCYSDAAWGVYSRRNLKFPAGELVEPYRKIIFPKFPYQFEYTDPVSGSGFRHTTYRAFSGDEVLLSRAEAYIHLGKYEEALRDMNIWLDSYLKVNHGLTDAKIMEWFKSVPYSSEKQLTPKQKFTPDFPIADEKQEAYLQVCMHMRRIATLQEGLRWFDVKRFGIVIHRFMLYNGYDAKYIDNILTVRDDRRAIQLPADVIASGMKPNPRAK